MNVMHKEMRMWWRKEQMQGAFRVFLLAKPLKKATKKATIVMVARKLIDFLSVVAFCSCHLPLAANRSCKS